MESKNVIALTKELVAFNTINPPGNEEELALFVGGLLTSNGFEVNYIPFEENRLHLIAEKGCTAQDPPLVLSGHFDTVPLGTKEWNDDPFDGIVKDGKLFGRGSSDMKGGLAAMIVAAIQAFEQGSPKGGVKLIITAGEELGCQGAVHMVSTFQKKRVARGIIVGEPTANIPAIGHKGGLYLELHVSGITAHSSMPHLGENAIYKIARAITKIENFELNAKKDELLGFPTLNVGKVSGGLNINSVPDRASFTIDARTTTKINHGQLIKQLQTELGAEIEIKTLVDLPAVSSSEESQFIQQVYDVCGISNAAAGYPKSLPYLTDASVLQAAFEGAPVVILGPGQPEMAHQTNEYCAITNLEKAVEIYKNIILNGGGNNE
ncbi:ArgE/DapE family deacylase [Maribellus comscasis]|uniref:Probable succinyl-diaminopimelate desuccinylase n=1 Tax=Maribellus comscasis TaxID=2681766 RepID=A0A6I6K3P3_9BACT|nr:M20 family metallopeptidase [Maribellus comscasis]QGY47197.1 ArgE/DapE family deacylase [Maribellus comscasis]